MTVTRNDRDRTYTSAGALVADVPIVRDVTTDFVNNDLRTKAVNAIAANATFMAIGSPSNAQVVAQVRLLTRECNALIRLALNIIDDAATDT